MARPFFETLRELRAGTTLEELGAELCKLVAAVKATGKPGELTLKLKLKPPKKGGMAYLLIEDSIAVKEPKLDKSDTVFFPIADNGLSRQDPSQSELPFGRRLNVEVDSDTGEIHNVQG